VMADDRASDMQALENGWTTERERALEIVTALFENHAPTRVIDGGGGGGSLLDVLLFEQGAESCIAMLQLHISRARGALTSSVRVTNSAEEAHAIKEAIKSMRKNKILIRTVDPASKKKRYMSTACLQCKETFKSRDRLALIGNVMVVHELCAPEWARTRMAASWFREKKKMQEGYCVVMLEEDSDEASSES